MCIMYHIIIYIYIHYYWCIYIYILSLLYILFHMYVYIYYYHYYYYQGTRVAATEWAGRTPHTSAHVPLGSHNQHPVDFSPQLSRQINKHVQTPYIYIVIVVVIVIVIVIVIQVQYGIVWYSYSHSYSFSMLQFVIVCDSYIWGGVISPTFFWMQDIGQRQFCLWQPLARYYKMLQDATRC